jgi:hypothetical protein
MQSCLRILLKPTRAQRNKRNFQLKVVLECKSCEAADKLLWHRCIPAWRGTVMCKKDNDASEVVRCGEP